MKARRDEAVRARTGEAVSALMDWAVQPGQVLPETVRRRAALVLADDLGAIVTAADEPPVARMRAAFVASTAAPEVTVFAPRTSRLDRYSAAAANGLAATWCELDEGYRAVPCHAGAYVLPALLAEAEVRDTPNEDVLSAFARAYEITVRFARAFLFATMSVHPHAAFATLGAAAGVSLIRGHDASLLLAAVTGAASMAFAGPYGHAIEGALVRNAWTSTGAWIGLRSADFAEAGIGGLPETPYDTFFSALGTNVEPGLLVAGLGEDWSILGGYHKVFACCQYAHAAVEATLALHARLGGRGRRTHDLDEIVVETHPRGLTLTTVEPATVLAAKFSLPHAAAAVALTGTGGQRAFSESSLKDEDIARLRRRVQLVPHDAIGHWPNDRPSRVTWRFRDGETWTESCESARGGADRPFEESTLIEKLRETSAGFPAMAGVLARIIAGDEAAAGGSWRATVRAMTEEAVGR